MNGMLWKPKKLKIRALFTTKVTWRRWQGIKDAGEAEIGSLVRYAAKDYRAIIQCHGMGQAMGLAPKHVRLGDHVALVSGLSMPLILRAAQDRGGYEVIGPTYMPGLMNGEGRTGAENRRLEEITLV